VEGGGVSAVLRPPSLPVSTGLQRIHLGDARLGPLYFAQVREDPEVEIEALSPAPDRALVVVSSGGCTALSLLAAGAGRVTAVDVNVAQNHLVELKAAAVTSIAGGTATAFLGGAPAPDRQRAATYAALRVHLSDEARRYWDGRPRQIARGVLTTGVTERFIAAVVRVLRLAVHSAERVDRLLGCRTLAEQRALYRREWNSRRWRMLFRLLVTRSAIARTYDVPILRGARVTRLGEHFRLLAEHALTELPVDTNYFLHQMLTGYYGAAVPPYLGEEESARLRASGLPLTLVDGSYTRYLRRLPSGSVHGFALSNICEWMSEGEVGELFAEIARVAAPGARVLFRNFLGHTEVPGEWRRRIVEDREWGTALVRRDRSLMQSRVAVCRVLDG
jgi:S-adenosylmethionine-diacylglycerol 3-amino-3-carboxypropyl transferase